MESKEPHVVEILTKGGKWRMHNNTNNQEGLFQQGQVKNGIKTMVVIGIGAGLYGFNLGRKGGYRRGVRDGYFTASQEFITALREVTEEMKKTKGK